MSLAGFKKQFNKANQMFSEKMTGAHGTELDTEFKEMERKVDVAGKMMDELITKTQEYLQPNPMARARLTAMRGLNNLQSKTRSTDYPQPETVLGDCMTKFGNDYGQDSGFGQALVRSGEAFKQMAGIKRSMEDSVKQNFLEPLTSLQHRDLKEIAQQRKKLEGRRLDYDCKKRSGRTDEDLSSAEKKFNESKSDAETAMRQFVNADPEHVAALEELIEAEMEYHQAAARILSQLKEQIRNGPSGAAGGAAATGRSSHPRNSSSASGRSSGSQAANYNNNSNNNNNNSNSNNRNSNDNDNSDAPAPTISMKPRIEASKAATPTCRALYSFSAENKAELAFEEGDTIKLLARIDENWFEGELKGNRGYFPVSYVNVIVPLPDSAD